MATSKSGWRQRRFVAFVLKEFRHILRDRRILLILFGMPVAPSAVLWLTLVTRSLSLCNENRLG